MKKQQLILVSIGLILFSVIFIFGKRLPPKSTTPVVPVASEPIAEISTEAILATAKEKLSPGQQAYVAKLESAVVRGDVKDQQIKVFKQLADFWRDSAHALLPYAYYSSEAAKLENSEKSLTFAAHFYLNGLRGQENPSIRKWMGLQSKELFEKALVLNPNNDSLKIGLGSTYLFGNISEAPMEGITLIREVAERDTTNMYAQFMLGVGGMISGQYDRAIERFRKVVAYQPQNPEVIVMLAESYERKGDKENAIKWYEEGKKIILNREILQEIDHRIEELRK